MALPYRSEVLADSPTYYYEFTEASGNIASSATALAGTAIGTPDRQQAGIPNGGYSVYFDGTGEGFSLTQGSTWGNNTNWTIECWAKIPTNVTNDRTTFMRWHNDANGSAPQILIRGEEGTTHHVFGYFHGIQAETSTDYNDGQWHHYVLKRTGSTSLAFFVDGASVSTSGSGGWTSPGTSQPFYIGTDNTSFNEDMYGYIAHVAIYTSTALSDARISAHYLAGKSATPQVPVSTATALTVMPAVLAQRNISINTGVATASATAPGGSKEDLPYKDAVLADSPATYYQFTEASGTTLVNHITPGTLNGTANSATLNQTGPTSKYKGVSRNAAGDETVADAMIGITYPSTVLNQNTNYSFEFWFKTNESMGVPISDDWFLFKSSTGTNGGTGITAYLDSATGYLTIQGSAVISLSYPVALDDQQWHHVVVTCAGSGTDVYSLYVDGATRDTDVTERSAPSGSGRIVMGYGGDGTIGTDNFCNITVAQLATYTTTLSNTRVAAHFNAMTSSINSTTPATGTALAVMPGVTAQKAVNYNATPSTASALVVDPVVIPGKTVNYSATPATATALAVDPTVVIQSNATVNVDPSLASVEVVMPQLPNVRIFVTPVTAAALTVMPVVIPGHELIYNATSANATALARENVEANLPTNHPYYQAVRGQVDADDIWVAFLDDPGATKVTEEVSEIFNLGTWSRTNAKYFGSMITSTDGPNDRLAANFDGINDYMQIGELNDDTNTGTYSIEFVFRTSRANQVIMAGQEVSSEGFAPGSAILRAVQVNTRDGRISLLGLGPGVVSNTYQELLVGDKNVSDGEWHHVVISSWWYTAERANDYTHSEVRGAMGIWVDGELDKRYSSVNVNFKMSRPDYVGRSITGGGNYFEGDISMLVARRGYGMPKYLIEQNYYVALGINPFRVAPAGAIAEAPNAKARGNSVRVLNVYLRNIHAGTVEVDRNIVFYDPTNGRLNTNIMAWSSPNNPGGIRDVITDERRLLDFQTDINMDNYDLINIIDGALTTDASASSKQRTDEYLAVALNTSRGRANKVLDDFYTSLKKLVVEGGKSWFIRDPEVAKRAGLIGNYVAKVPVREKSIASTGKPFWGQLGAGLVDEYDYWAWRNNPWSNFADNPANGSAAWNSDNEYQYEDTHYVSGERIVATENGLTNLVGPTLSEVINKIHANPFTRTGQELAMRYAPNISGLQIGQELLFQTRVYAKYANGAKDNLPIFSVHPDNVFYGTIIAKEFAQDWVGRTMVSNPQSDYATTIIIKEGDLVDGIASLGRIAMSFNNDIAAPQFMRMGLVDVNEPESKKRFQMSTYRSGGSYIAVNVNGQVTGVTGQTPGGTPQPDTSQNTSTTGWYVFQPNEQASYKEINGDMGRRIFEWLAEGTDNPGDGDKLIGVESGTASATIVDPTTTVVRNTVITVGTAIATATAVFASDDVQVLVTPATATARVNMFEKKIEVEPATAYAEALDDYNAIFERGKQVGMTFYRTANKTVILYLRSER